MQEVAERQLKLLDILSLRDCSHLASDGSKGPRTFSTPQPPPFGTGTTRCSPSGTFAHNVPGAQPKFVGFPSSVPRRSLPNRTWEPGRKREEGPRPLAAVASSSQQVNASERRQRPASARASAPSLSQAQLLALRREVTAIRRAKELQAQGAQKHAASPHIADEAPAPRWLYALDGDAVDDLI